jgi:endo-1,3-1,4-beta-glycanase ExoK
VAYPENVELSVAREFCGTILRAKRPAAVALFVVMAILNVLATNCSADDKGQTGGGASFYDTFATLDRKRWSVSDGWSNGDYQNCIWSAGSVAARGNSLDLVLGEISGVARPYKCAEIKTNEFYGYGTYEVRMRTVAAPGVVSAFFTYSGPPAKPHDEIDFEFLGKNPGSVQLNYFAHAVGKHERAISLGFDATQAMNDYAFEWMPDSLRWFVNGKLVHEAKRKSTEPFPASPGQIVMMIWNGRGQGMEQWLGRFEYPGQPLIAQYEYVAFTEAGKPCQFPKSIVCRQGADSQTAK